jgi:hypothetical protein
MAKMNKKKLLSALKSDFESAESYRDVEDQKIEKRKAEYDGNPYGNEKKGKSAIVSKDIKRQSEWQHATILDPFVTDSEIIKCSPITWEDEKSARQNELLLNTQFCRQFDRYNFMSKALKVLDREGTAVIQCGWDYEDEEVISEAPIIEVDGFGREFIAGMTEVSETVIKVNKPTAKVCRNEDVYIDPTCMGDMDNCQFIIYRYETDLSSLKQDGRYKNLEKIKPDAHDANSHQDYESGGSDLSDFQFKDNARKKMVVYEYWGNFDINKDGVAEPIVCAWIDDVIIRLQDNPYPDGKPPFLVVPFNSVPFQVYGEANADLISDNQKIKTAITRGLIDNMAQSNNGQVGLKKGALDPANKKNFVDGKNFEYNGRTADFWNGSYNQIPGSAFDMLAMMNNEIESITGIKGFSGGISGNSLGGTATGARGALDATATRTLNIVRNVAENLVKPLMRKWMSYNAEFLDDQEIVRVTNEQFVEIRRDDLEGKVDMDISISTQEDNAAKSQELSFLLQTIGPNEDPMIRKEIMADIMELMRMPDKAKKLREYQPQPDPVQEQMKQIELERLQLENELIKADITDKYARAEENKIDAQRKMAETQLKLSQARKLDSEADMKDLEFIEKDEGVTHQREMEKKEFDRLSNLDTLAFQANQGDTNLGVSK